MVRRGGQRVTGWKAVAGVAAIAVVTAGCGTRLERAEIRAVHDAGKAAPAGEMAAAADGDVSAPGADAVALPAGPTPAAVGGPAEVGEAPRGGTAPDGSGGRQGGPQAGSAGSSVPATGSRAGGSGAGSAAGSSNGGSAAASRPTTAAPGAPAPSAPANQAPITLGHVGTYSGIVGAQLASALPTAQVWAKSVNARGGLNGHPVRLITADDGTDPARNLALTKDMVENQGVVAFVGNQVPFSVTGSEAYLREKKIPAVGGDVVHPQWWQSPILFPQGQFIDTLLTEAARQGVKAQKKRFGLFYCAEAPPCQHANDVYKAGAAEKAGAQLVYSAQVSITQPDFTAECLQAQRNNVETVFLAADAATNTRVARSCAQQGFKPFYVTQTIAVSNALAKEPPLEGLTVVSPVFPWVATDTPGAQEYRQALQTYSSGTEPAGPGAIVWVAGKLMERAAAKLGPTPTAAQVLEGLYALRDETLGGLMTPVTYRPGTTPLIENSCAFLVKVVNGKWTAPQGSQQAC
jgi:branched-chain amino acid transport system substrate-binding protein